ncbi:MAG: hypothetical protein ACI4GO_08315 [Hominenteromicrobium sp.]
MNAGAAFRRSIPEIARGCRILLAGLAVCVSLCLTALFPALFGFRPFIVTESDHVSYPEGALAYYRYTPAGEVVSGMPIVINSSGGKTVCIVSGKDEADRVFFTRDETAAVPFEYAEGVPAAFCLPYVGMAAGVLIRPAVLWAAASAACLLTLGGFVLPKLVYSPKYGKPGKGKS